MADMLAIEVTALGGPEVLKRVRRPIPQPKRGQVLIAQQAVGVNFVDLNHRAGHPYPTKAPFIPGIEAAGRVEAVGEGVDPELVGEMIGYAGAMPGAYAEYAAIDEELVFPLPADVTPRRAVSIIMQAMTAYYLSHLAHPVLEGETVLVHAAAGGVGGYLVQFAKARGGIVVGTSRKATRLETIKSLGADHAFQLVEADFTSAMLERTSGCDVVFDSLGGDYFMPGLRCLNARGHYVGYGLAAGKVPKFDPAILSGNLGETLHGGSLSVQWVASRNFIGSRQDRHRISAAVFDAVARNEIILPEVTEYALEDARLAHEAFEAGAVDGKLILTR